MISKLKKLKVYTTQVSMPAEWTENVRKCLFSKNSSSLRNDRQTSWIVKVERFEIMAHFEYYSSMFYKP